MAKAKHETNDKKARKARWWERRSAADDGALIDGDAEQDPEEGFWAERFKFDAYRPARQNVVDDLWGRYGYGGYSLSPWEQKRNAEDAEAFKLGQSLKMVQGFVDTFATGDLSYQVRFDDATSTAGTDMERRVVHVSHKPLFDPTLTASEANTILTAMGCHEASHVRYGRNTYMAVYGAISRGTLDTELSPKVSNLLDDVRIERRFAADYPGYAHIFDPAIEYVARSTFDDSGSYPTEVLDPWNTAVAATRYAKHGRWTPETTGERDWWQAWAERWTRDDDVDRHLDGVREGVEHLKQRERDEQRRQAEKQEQGEGQGQDASQPSQSGESQPQQSQPTDKQGEGQGPTMPDSCFAHEVDETATKNGETSCSPGVSAQREAERGRELTDPDITWGISGEVHWNTGGMAKSHVAVPHGASASIRAAFNRSRTEHSETERLHKSGRIDSRGLARIASRDYRICARRRAPSVTRWRVWLMVDCSSSMKDGVSRIGAARGVAAALATATRFMPNVSLDIFGWTTGWKHETRFGVQRVWSDGDPIANIGILGAGFKMNGTPDAEVLQWAAHEMPKHLRPGERPLIIMASDGKGTLNRLINTGQVKTGKELGDAWKSIDANPVADARKAGIGVVSVAFDAGMLEMQEKVYGQGNFIPYAGSVAASAGPLGKMLARLATSGR